MMLTKKKMLAFACAAVLLAGCGGGSGSSSGGDKSSGGVTHACTAEMMGMTATITLTAPSEKSDVKSITMDIDMPASYFGLDSFAALEDNQDNMDIQSQIVSELSDQLSLPKTDVFAKTTDDNLKVTLTLHENNMREILGLKDEASLVLEDMVSELQLKDNASCN